MSTQTPPPPQGHTRLQSAISLAAAGKYAEAKAVLLRIVQQTPNDPVALSVLVASLSALKEYETALYYADRAVEVAPTSAGALANRARVHILAKRVPEGVADLRAALAANPSNMEARLALVHVLHTRNELDEAMRLIEEVKNGARGSVAFNDLHAGVLLAMGRADEALAIQKAMIPRDPSNPTIAERAAGAAVYALGSTPAEIKELASRFGRLVSVRVAVSRPPFSNTPDPERALRIGFVGGDFRNHASMRFFEPLAAGRDRTRVELVCYMTSPAEDASTARVRAISDRFERVHTLSAAALAAKVRADGIDVLVDMSGHTIANRLEAFHHHAAPVQMTWFGQPTTTGVTAIDYRIVDSFTDPAGTEGDNVERLLRLDPCGFSFRPVEGASDVQAPPSQRENSPTRGTITFGCFNNLTKMNDQTFGLWARILKDVPGATLRLRHFGFTNPGVCDSVRARLDAAGLNGQAAQRIRIDGPAKGSLSLMECYHDVDIALDTFPYSGMTTTCEALSMGVPVVGLAMDRSVSRHSLSILANCGLADLVAHTPDDYVRIAVALARDPMRLAEIRATARARMARVVGDGPGFARRFEAGVRSAWREWCAGRAGRA